MKLNFIVLTLCGLQTGSSTCQSCDCNGNSDTCDPITGVCIDCQSNTGGDNCEICEDGYYGDAAAGCRG